MAPSPWCRSKQAEVGPRSHLPSALSPARRFIQSLVLGRAGWCPHPQGSAGAQLPRRGYRGARLLLASQSRSR